ncbi:hypothetical protein EJ05DRAFT_533124 [Pseudovirgaria hyperparasitica]|uniref:Calcium uniporter protein n=1 Tax=Pseudovirgaria hyperparasitica TaxID=470096 RepID=A0A6A6VYW2_9PEZI|nr:uncharacterized protein EJ05DRAFT_533124 [Pseudovirgaria hyperparasitica]KAF2754934.1 hypothetical protein EJ05DRAFT_533124 [Pseudovirgaria hyperparasitica]
MRVTIFEVESQLQTASWLRHSLSATPHDSSYSQPAANLSQNVTDEEKNHYHEAVVASKEKQIRTPWHREGSDKAPVARQRSAGAMTKGKLLTTPSRMLKLILPLTTKDVNTDRKDVEPLALLVHPQQPLSYLERLIQSELPILEIDNKEKIPAVYFRAEDSTDSAIEHKKKINREATQQEPEEERTDEQDDDAQHLEKADEIKIDGKTERTGKINKKDSTIANKLRGGPGEGGVESYSGLGHENSSSHERKFVRWSSSTEIGDFIRDAARGKEFAVEIEGAPADIRVGVPSFGDRTYYLRMRLRKTAKKLSTLADLKNECDHIAHRHAQRVAFSGFFGLCGWWGVVSWLTFATELGWDTMEPVTYLVGLSTLIGGYVWFLYHNREVSYRSAMNITISRRQQKLYSSKGFDVDKWQHLIEEGNALRKEIKAVADEYDVEWDEQRDEKDEKVMKALREEREKKKERKKDKEEEEKDDE